MKKAVDTFVQKNKALLVVCDLDGTLLNSEGKVSKFTEKTIKQFIKQGNIFCIATARPFRSTSAIYEQLNLKSICVNYNGASLSNPHDQYFSGINYMFSVNIAQTILNDKKILKNVINIVLENENATFIYKKIKNKELLNKIHNWFHIYSNNNIIYGNEIKNIQFNPHTISLVTHISKNVFIINRLMGLYEILSIKTYEIDEEYNIIEIGIPIASKGHALDYLSAFYGIDMSHTIAFGDNDNDVELLQKARFSFAMLNGSNTSKFAAKFITTKSNDEDGVARTLLSFLKNKN